MRGSRFIAATYRTEDKVQESAILMVAWTVGGYDDQLLPQARPVGDDGDGPVPRTLYAIIELRRTSCGSEEVASGSVGELVVMIRVRRHLPQSSPTLCIHVQVEMYTPNFIPAYLDSNNINLSNSLPCRRADPTQCRSNALRKACSACSEIKLSALTSTALES